MPGQSLNLLLFLVLTGLLLSCGKRSGKEAPRFIPGQIVTEGDGSGLSADRRLARTWKDYDGDGLSDRKDPDIDDDGFPNLMDQHPYNEKLTGSDTDKDGIPDFVDMAGPFAEEQLRIFRVKGTLIMNGSEKFSAGELESLNEIISHPEIGSQLSFTKLKLIVKYAEKDRTGQARADFDPFWLQISLFPQADGKEFIASVVHELGHVHAAEHPETFGLFRDGFHAWTSPSLYGASSPEEGYAESFLYRIFLKKIFPINGSRFESAP